MIINEFFFDSMYSSPVSNHELHRKNGSSCARDTLPKFYNPHCTNILYQIFDFDNVWKALRIYLKYLKLIKYFFIK